MPSQQQQVKRVLMGPTRWSPTPAQLMILQDLYRCGLRTLNESLIQQITAHLSAYGRIEHKNVYYWFQNHRARDRKKLRHRLRSNHHLLTWPVTATMPYACGGGVFEHAAGGQLLAPAASYGYYYPATAYGAPPHTPPWPNQMLRYHYQAGSGVAQPPASEVLGGPEYSLAKLTDNFSVAAVDDNNVAIDRVGPPRFELVPPFCGPLKTLDLFPGGR